MSVCISPLCEETLVNRHMRGWWHAVVLVVWPGPFACYRVNREVGGRRPGAVQSCGSILAAHALLLSFHCRERKKPRQLKPLHCMRVPACPASRTFSAAGRDGSWERGRTGALQTCGSATAERGRWRPSSWCTSCSRGCSWDSRCPCTQRSPPAQPGSPSRIHWQQLDVLGVRKVPSLHHRKALLVLLDKSSEGQD